MTIYIRIKHDADYIYVLMDFPTDSVIEYAGGTALPTTPADTAGIVLDTNDDRGTAPHADDYLFRIRWSSPSAYVQITRQGTGSAWSDLLPNPAGFVGASSMDAGNDPYSPSPHLIYELRVPISYIGQKATYGAGVLAADGTLGFIGWPQPFKMSDFMNPNHWGDLNMTEQVVPEFPSGALFIATVIVACTLLLLRAKRETRIQAEPE
jgi:hypothetical protein